MKVAFDVGLLERLDFAGEYMFYVEGHAVLLKYLAPNEVEGKKRGLRSRAHGGNSHLTSLCTFRYTFDLGDARDEVSEDRWNVMDGREVGTLYGYTLCDLPVRVGLNVVSR